MIIISMGSGRKAGIEDPENQRKSINKEQRHISHNAIALFILFAHTSLTSYAPRQATVIEHPLRRRGFPLVTSAVMSPIDEAIQLTASIWAIMPIFRVFLTSAFRSEVCLLALAEKGRRRLVFCMRTSLCIEGRHDRWAALEKKTSIT